jgi:hypothetical protein
MSDYDFSGLSSRSFEQMVQALSLKIIGPGVVVFGDGPDGGREATYQGRLQGFPSKKECWDGYIVIQVKFCQRPKHDSKADTTWLMSQLKKELNDFADPKKKRNKPTYYILATNVVLSSVFQKGGKDRVSKLIKFYESKVPMKDFAIWDYDQICRFLDGNKDVRSSYKAWITPGDVLASISKNLSFQLPDFFDVMTNFLQKELLEDQYSKLEQAGHRPENRIQLEKVFVDLPSFLNRQAEPPEEKDPLPPGFLSHMLKIGSMRLNGATRESHYIAGSISTVKDEHEHGRYVLIGGPGQGKSTLGQFLCQVHRASLLKDRKKLDLDTKKALQSIQKQCFDHNLDINIAKRFPVRIDLARFAKALAMEGGMKALSVLSYMVSQIKNKTNYELHAADFRKWLEVYPWLVVFDGLDEVPSSSNRKEVMCAIRDFLIDASSLDSDVLILATTRPQGYNEEFSPNRYWHHWLAPLSVPRALCYGKCLVDNTYPSNNQRRAEINERMKRASEVPATAKLMESPLQVTIMSRLLAQIAQPPQERYNLFKQYYEIIYRREMEREVEPLSRILRDFKPDVDTIHYQMGLLLQIESERAKHTDATMSHKEFEQVVRDRLAQEGHQKEELDKLTNTIASCAIDRLVFLVPSLCGRIGFEIRSLQEFMAAEALMETSDDIAVARLKRIASIPFWRNVFLFAAGRVFADRQYLRDHVAHICAELNDDPSDPLGHQVLTGSLLALALLEDGSARHQPAFGQILVSNALRLLNLPSDASTKQLKDVYDSNYFNIYEEEIIRQLERTPITTCLNSWNLLNYLITRGESWAEALANRKWPTDIPTQIKLITTDISEADGKWKARKLAEIIFNVDVNTIVNLIRYGIGMETSRFCFIEAPLRQSLQFIFTTPTFNIKTELNGVELSMIPMSSEVTNNYSQLSSIKNAHPSWQAFIESAHFIKAPSHLSLSQALNKISENFMPEQYVFLPWPIQACVQYCRTSSELKLLAVKAENGELGTLPDWQAAEKRWISQGVKMKDLDYMTDDRCPYSSNIANLGFPLSGVNVVYYLTNPKNNKLILSLLKLLIGTKREKLRKSFCSCIINNLSVLSNDVLIEHMEIIEQTILANPSLCKYIFIEPVLHLSNISDQNDKIINLMDVIGRNIEYCFGHGYAHCAHSTDHKAFMQKVEQMVEKLSIIYQNNNKYKGILRLISRIIISQPFLVKPNFERLASIDAVNISESELILCMTQKNLTCEDFHKLSTKLIHLSLTNSGIIQEVLNIYESYQMDNINAIVLLEDLLKQSSPDNVSEKSNVIRLMQDIISRRTSGVDQMEVWTKLDLPKGLYELLVD